MIEEYNTASPTETEAFGEALAQKFRLNLQKKSKFRRALALAKGE